MSEEKTNKPSLIKKLTKSAVVLGFFVALTILILNFFDLISLNFFNILYLILFFSGYYLFRVTNEINEEISPLFGFLALLFFGSGASLVLNSITFDEVILVPALTTSEGTIIRSFQLSTVELLDALSGSFLWAFVPTSFFSLTTYLNKFISIDFYVKWLLGVQKKLIYFIFFTFFYFTYLRNEVLMQLRVFQATLIDWLIILTIIGLVLHSFNNHLKQYSGEKKRISPKNGLIEQRHIQEIKELRNQEIKDLEKTQEAFVEHGYKEPLLIHLITSLRNNGYSVMETSYLIEPLSRYSDSFIPSFAFSWWKKRLKEKNKERRETALSKQMDYIDMAEEGKKPKEIQEKYGNKK